MKIEDLKNITEQQAKQLLVELYTSFENDVEFYTTRDDIEYSKLLKQIFETRMERINHKLNRYGRLNQI